MSLSSGNSGINNEKEKLKRIKLLAVDNYYIL